MVGARFEGETRPPRAADWRVALVLGIAGGVAVALLFPYLRATMPPREGGAHHHFPIAVAAVLGGAQNAVPLFLFAWVGLHLGGSLGLDSPMLRAWMSRRSFAGPRHLGPAILVGIAAAAIVAALDHTVFAGALPPSAAAIHVERWQGALASFYGGIAEEVLTRLFLMTLIAWALAKVTRRSSPEVFVVAIVLAALAFGAGHLPMAAKLFGSLTGPLIARTLVLNGLSGLAFGALYWRWGFEHAMVAHFAGDLVLHVAFAG